MTDTPKTAEELDEMRARALHDYTEKGFPARVRTGWDGATGGSKVVYRNRARALREADEAAGLKIVPAKATEEMVRAFTGDQGCEPTWGLASMGTANTVEDLNAAIAAGAILEDGK